MKWLEDWDDWSGRRPKLATVICALLAFISVRVLLRALHILPPLHASPPDHPQFHDLLAVVESLLQLLGVIYLWQMHFFAAILFATEAIVTTLAGLYLGFINPGEHILALRTVHPQVVFAAMALGTTLHTAVALYAWRITTRPQNVSPAGA